MTVPERASGARRHQPQGSQVDSARLGSPLTQPARPALVVRTCVGCRQRDAQTHLIRVVACDGTLVVDHQGSQPGRGAYLHNDSKCWDLAVRRKPWARALKVPGPLADTHLWESLDEVSHPKGERP